MSSWGNGPIALAKLASSNVTRISGSALQFYQGTAPFRGRISLFVAVKASKTKFEGHNSQVKVYICTKKAFFFFMRAASKVFFFFVMKPYATFASKTKIEDSLTSFMLVMISIHSVIHQSCFQET